MGTNWEQILGCGDCADIQDAYEDLVYQAGVMLGDYEDHKIPVAYPLNPEFMDESDRLRLFYPDEKSVNNEFYLAQLETHKDNNDRPYQLLYLGDPLYNDLLKGIIRDPDHFLTEDHLGYLACFIGIIEYLDDLPVLIISEHDAPSAEEIRESIEANPCEDYTEQPDSFCEPSPAEEQTPTEEIPAEPAQAEPEYVAKSISQLLPGDRFRRFFTLRKASLRTTKKGQPYLDGLLTDETGWIALKAWNYNGTVGPDDNDTEVLVTGSVALYRGKPYAEISEILSRREHPDEVLPF